MTNILSINIFLFVFRLSSIFCLNPFIPRNICLTRPAHLPNSIQWKVLRSFLKIHFYQDKKANKQHFYQDKTMVISLIYL